MPTCEERVLFPWQVPILNCKGKALAQTIPDYQVCLPEQKAALYFLPKDSLYLMGSDADTDSTQGNKKLFMGLSTEI